MGTETLAWVGACAAASDAMAIAADMGMGPLPGLAAGALAAFAAANLARTLARGGRA